jgi:thymidine kinase
MDARPYVQGRVKVVSGPVKSSKNRAVEVFLNRLVHSEYLANHPDAVVTFRHPEDDPNPEYIGEHRVKVSDNLYQIAESVTPNTRTVIIVGASHFSSLEIITLADALVRSNRDVVVSGLNLDAQGKPYLTMPGLMAIADEVELAKASCAQYDCQSKQANRSILTPDGRYFPVCGHHHNPTNNLSGGWFELDTGGMFSGKTDSLMDKIARATHEDIPYAFFKSAIDVRYGQEGGRGVFELHKATQHNKDGLHAILVPEAKHILEYLGGHPKVKTVFVTEMQFIPGIYDVVFELVSKGYHVYGDGLARGWNRQPFNEYPNLMCLADSVKIHHGICVQCGDPSTESHLLVQDAKKQLVKPGGKGEYEARCLSCWNVEKEEPLKYKFEKFRWS